MTVTRPPAASRQLDAHFYDDLWRRLFASGRLPLHLPPDGELWQQDLGRSLRLTRQWLGPLAGRQVLELGCGPGDYTIWLARQGAHVTAIDAAPASLAITRQRASANGVANRVQLGQMAAESLPLRGGRFDLVLGFGLLHHAAPAWLAPEVRRVLRPGGRAIFREPLGMNPLLDLARDYLPYRDKRRSLNEHPLTYRDIAQVGRHFRGYRQRELYLLSMVGRVAGGGESSPLLSLLWRLDEMLLRRWPALRRWCRYVLLEYYA